MATRAGGLTVNRFMVWWCRFFMVWATLALIANTLELDLFWASLDVVVIVGHLYYLSLFTQRRDAEHE